MLSNIARLNKLSFTRTTIPTARIIRMCLVGFASWTSRAMNSAMQINITVINSMMVTIVFTKNKVFNPIIRYYVVFVMNLLSWIEVSANMLFHNITMFINISFPILMRVIGVRRLNELISIIKHNSLVSRMFSNSVQASTRFCAVRPQSASLNNNIIATYTLTKPSRLCPLVFDTG